MTDLPPDPWVVGETSTGELVLAASGDRPEDDTVVWLNDEQTTVGDIHAVDLNAGWEDVPFPLSALQGVPAPPTLREARTLIAARRAARSAQ